MKKLLFILALLCAPLARGQATYPVSYSTGGNITATNAACVPAACVGVGIPTPSAAVLTVGITGTFSGTLAVEESQDGGTTFTSAGASLTSTGTTSYVIAGFTQFRVRASAFASGNAGVSLQLSNAPSGGVTSGTADPTGNTCTADQLYVQTTTGNLYSCDAGVFAKVGPSAGGGGTVTSVSFTGGLISVATPTTTPALTVAGTSGGIPYFSSASTWASSAAGTVNTLMKWGGAGNPPIASSVTDNGTTVSTAELVNFSGTGAAATSPFLLSGTLFTGGSGTSTVPYAYINQGASPSTWSTAGTMFGLNAPTGFTGNYLDFRLNGSNSAFAVSSAGNITGQGITVGGGVTSTGARVSGALLGTATNCSSAASPAVCAAAAAGTVAIPAGATQTLQINTSAVAASSIILLTVDESLGTKLSVTCNTTAATLTQPFVTARSAGASFTIEEPATTTANPVCVSYLVIN